MDKFISKTLIVCGFLFLTTIVSAQTPPVILWSNSLTETAPSGFFPRIIKTTDGGYLIVGGSSWNDPGLHGYVAKLKDNGTLEWEKYFKTYGNEEFVSAIQTSDGGYVIVGNKNSPFVNGGSLSENIGVIKIDATGSLLWEKIYGGSGIEEVKDMVQTNDGGYLIVGASNSNDRDFPGYHFGGNGKPSDAFALRLDDKGDLLWSKLLGGSASDIFYSVIQLHDGEFIVGGYSDSKNGDLYGTDPAIDGYPWMVKLADPGVIQWQKKFPKDTIYVVAFNDIITTPDSGFLTVGTSSFSNTSSPNYRPNGNMGIVKFDKDRNIQWHRAFGGSGTDNGRAIIQTSDGGYAAIGISSSIGYDVTENKGGLDYFIVKISNGGSLEWSKSIGGNRDEWGHDLVQANDGSLVLAGATQSNNNGDVPQHNSGDKYWIVKLGDSTLVSSVGKIGKQDFTIYPSLVEDLLNIRTSESLLNANLSIFNIEGKAITSQKLSNSFTSINISNYPAGIYFVQLIKNKEIAIEKFMKK